VVVSSTAVIFVISWGLYVFGRLGIKLSSKLLQAVSENLPKRFASRCWWIHYPVGKDLYARIFV